MLLPCFPGTEANLPGPPNALVEFESNQDLNLNRLIYVYENVYWCILHLNHHRFKHAFFIYIWILIVHTCGEEWLSPESLVAARKLRILRRENGGGPQPGRSDDWYQPQISWLGIGRMDVCLLFRVSSTPKQCWKETQEQWVSYVFLRAGHAMAICLNNLDHGDRENVMVNDG